MPPETDAAQRKTVAVVGASSDRRKFGNKGVRAFVAAGWKVFPVNPKEKTVEGLPAHGSVTEIASPLDVISLYLPPTVGTTLLPEIAAKAPGELWLNPGAVDSTLLQHAAELGIKTRQLCSILEVGCHPSDFGG